MSETATTTTTIDPEAIVETRRGEFVISTDRARLDLDVIHGFLTNCYWAKGIPRDIVRCSIERSLCFGVYDASAHEIPRLAKEARHGAPDARSKAPRSGALKYPQVGFARVVSDFATVAYLGDVFVLESHRGRGLSKWLMECIVQHPALQNLRRWILLTRDAHGLYSKYGFTPVKAPERYMELHRPNVYDGF
jgi:GNAT superfamily N-acetyltransferase